MSRFANAARFACLVVLTALPVTAAFAEDAANRVQLSASAVREVPNDTVEVTLHSELQARDLATLNNDLNAVTGRAADVVRAEVSIDLQTFPAGTWPQYDQETGELQRWRGRQQIRLSSTEFSTVQRVLQQLQQTLAVSQLHYSLSDSARDAVEDELIREALLKLKHRSALIAHEMGMRDVHFVLLKVDTGDGGFDPGPQEYATMARSAVAAAPTLEGGSARVSVTVHAEVDLLQ
ncbi:MAG: SIMPL domain-containing protein [Pseudomonadota bacterium]